MAKKRAGLAGFTLVEVMFVAAVVGLLATLTIPMWKTARQQSRTSVFVHDLRVIVDLFELYALHYGGYPEDTASGVVPPGMVEYLGTRVNWSDKTPVGGVWDWDNDSIGIQGGVTVIGSSLSLPDLRVIDDKIDDGNLTSGRFRRTGAGGYTYIITE